MPRPSTAAERPELRTVIYEAVDPADTFIGLRVLPLFRVDENTGQYPVIAPEVTLAIPNTRWSASGH